MAKILVIGFQSLSLRGGCLMLGERCSKARMDDNR
jgi:hypothetical protein